MSRTIALIDFGSLVHPIWHMSQDDPDPNATSVKAVARVRAIASGQPHVAVCYDAGKSFRRDIDPTYKAQRPESLATLQHQIGLALETLRADGFPCWGVKGFEGDDIVATAARLALREDDTVVIIHSVDKDLLATVSDRVTMEKPSLGQNPPVTYTPAMVKERLGVEPSQVVDYLALCGDTADNIKGAEKIGPKNAASLLNTFGNLDDLYTALDEEGAALKPAIFTSLQAFRPRLDTVRALLTLRTDVPIPFEEIFKPRVPVDVAVFGDDEEMMADIQEALPTIGGHDVQNAGPVQHRIVVQGSTDVGISEANEYGNSSGVQGSADKTHQAENRGGPDSRPSPRVATSAVVVRQPEVVNGAPVEWEHQLDPRNIAEAKSLAESLMASRLFSAYGHPAGILSTILAGRELGYPAMASLRAFHILDGKPAMSADFVRGLVLKSGLVDYLRCTERTPERATFAIKRKGDPEFVMSFTMDEAKAAGIVKPNSGWVRWPADMLVARCSIKICRLVVPEISHGMYEPSEVER